MFEKYRILLQIAIDNDDTEEAHSNADDILCDIALDASNGKLYPHEVEELVKMYAKVSKWYA